MTAHVHFAVVAIERANTKSSQVTGPKHFVQDDICFTSYLASSSPARLCGVGIGLSNWIPLTTGEEPAEVPDEHGNSPS